MKRFKSLFTEAKVEVDDISVGKKKKKPAGVKADEPLKGYAYNEDEQEEKYFVVKVTGKGPRGSNHMNVKTRAVSHKAALEKIKKQYPNTSVSIVKEDFETQLSLAIEEIELDEALSPKEKEKRLLMIKKAVEKLNRANIDKIKKQAMRDMKASGMFDDVIDEETELEEDDSFRPSEGDLKRNTYLRYNVKQLEPMLRDALKAHDENEYMKRASAQHYRQTGRYLPNESPDDYQKRKKKLENKLKLLQKAYASAKVRRQRALQNKQNRTNESIADDAPLTRKTDDGKHVQLHKDRKIMSAIRKGMTDHEKKHMGRAYRDDTDIVHRDTGKTMGSIHGKTVDQARSEIRKHIAKHHPETEKPKFGDVQNVSSTRKIYTVRDEAEVERIKDKYKKATDGKYTVRPMKRKEGFKVYVDKKGVNENQTESVINELSPELLKRYRDKAVKQFKQSDKKRNDPGYTDAKRKEHDKRATKRFKGSQSASQKIRDRGGYSEVPAGHVKMTNDNGTVRYIGPSDVKKYQELGWKRTR